MRMGNPSMRKIVRNAESDGISPSSEQSTYGGITWKSLLFGGVTVVAAAVTAVLLQTAVVNNNEALFAVLLIAVLASAVPMLIISLIVAFFPNTIKVLGVVYSVLQGILIGSVSFFADVEYRGVVMAALLATIIVFVVCIVLNKLLEVRISNKFMRGMFIAFVSIVAVELVLFILSLFVPTMSNLFTSAYLWMQLGISAVCVVYATVMLMWDLQSAERIVELGAPKKYEWQVAFSLVTTIVYMYVEILELLIRIAMLLGRNDN